VFVRGSGIVLKAFNVPRHGDVDCCVVVVLIKG
jgi:hypothetical protein